MNAIKKINNIIINVEKFLIAGSVIVMSVILIANVLSRLIFERSIYAAEEIGQYCIYLITFIGLSYAVTTGKHIHMLGIFEMVPQKMQKIGAIIIALVTGVTMGVLTYIAIQYVERLYILGKVSVNLQIPTWIIVCFISIGFLFSTLQYILVFAKNIKNKEVYLGVDSEYIPDIKREVKQ